MKRGAVILIVLALGGPAAGSGYLLGRAGGGDLNAAILTGRRLGRRAGKSAGFDRGYAAGLREGRAAGYLRAYRASYHAAAHTAAKG